jgi:hypothetical protein
MTINLESEGEVIQAGKSTGLNVTHDTDADDGEAQHYCRGEDLLRLHHEQPAARALYWDHESY